MHQEKYEVEISWNEAGQSTAKFSGPNCPAMSITPAPPELLVMKSLINSQATENRVAAE